MATNDVQPSYLDNLLTFYKNLGAADGTPAATPPTPNDPTELFTGIGNWADFCIAPREEVIRHPNEPIDNFPTEYDDEQEGYSPYNPHTAEDYAHDNRPPNLPMPNLTVDSFFDAANMLTGSYLDTISYAWTTLRDDHNNFMQGKMSADPKSGYGTNDFFGAIEDIFNDWDGEAQQAAHVYANRLKDAFEAQVRMTGWLADSLIAYTGIVHGARRRMLDLMNAFRQTMRNKEKSSGQTERTFLIGALTAVVSAMVGAGATIMTTETGLGIAVSAQFISLAIGITNQLLTGSNGSVDGDDYADIAVSYLKHAGEVVADMKTAIDRLVDGNDPQNPMRFLDDDSKWLPVPPPPVTRKQFDENPNAIDDLEPPRS
jgi:hypothetical protein